MNEEKTVFERIILGEIPSVKLHEDALCVVIMDAFPQTKGQVLVIPKQPTPYLFDIDSETYQHVWSVTKHVVHAIDAALEPLRTCVIVEGFEVPHAHIRLHPAYEPRLPLGTATQADPATLQEIADQIKKRITL